MRLELTTFSLGSTHPNARSKIGHSRYEGPICDNGDVNPSVKSSSVWRL